MIKLRHLPAQFSISSQVCYEIRYPGNLNGICLPQAFHFFVWYISFLAVHIFHIHFIACPQLFHIQLVTFFITCQVWFIYLFHSLPWAISYLPVGYFIACQVQFFLSISFLSLGHFIATSLHFSLPGRCDLFIHFIPCPGPFHTHPVGFFIACQVQFFLSISFLALGYFIPSSLHFSLLVRCDFLSISFLGLGQFIHTLSHCSLPATSHFHCLPCAISYPFHSLPLVLTISHGLPSVKSALPNMKMHAFPPLHIPPKENHSWFDQKIR